MFGSPEHIERYIYGKVSFYPPACISSRNFFTMDIEKEPLHPQSHSDESIVDMSSKGVLNEEHLDLRVGQEAQSHNAGRAGRIVSRGLKGIVVFLIAFLPPMASGLLSVLSSMATTVFCR